MVDLPTFRKWALDLPETVEAPHFDVPSFRVHKKIFATMRIRENRACLKLSPEDQSVFCAYDKAIFFPVNGYWGKQGFTFVDLGKVRKDMFKDALKAAYNEVAAAKKAKKK